jgi:hypothetical protein
LKNLPGCAYHRLQIEDLDSASNDMDNPPPEDLANLQTVARNYIASVLGRIDAICAELAKGRGSDMPGIGRATVAPG